MADGGPPEVQPTFVIILWPLMDEDRLGGGLAGIKVEDVKIQSEVDPRITPQRTRSLSDRLGQGCNRLYRRCRVPGRSVAMARRVDVRRRRCDPLLGSPFMGKSLGTITTRRPGPVAVLRACSLLDHTLGEHRMGAGTLALRVFRNRPRHRLDRPAPRGEMVRHHLLRPDGHQHDPR